MQPLSPTRSNRNPGEAGFLLVAMIFAVALVLIFLAVAAPIVAKDLQREREIELKHRGDQYVRAIRVYYRKFGHYPGSIDELASSNNMRFLRQKYVDPMTGKDDWRIIHVGENQTQVTAFFGQPLAGINSTGLGSAAGMTSSTGSTNTGSTGTSSTGSSGTDATSLGGGGPIMGVSSLSPKTSIISFRGQTTYNTWEFIYDPRIEALYNKSNILGGGGLGSTNATDLGKSPDNSGNPPAPSTNTPSPTAP